MSPSWWLSLWVTLGPRISTRIFIQTNHPVCHNHSKQPQKNWRNPESPRDNTWQSLGLILSCNKVLMVDPVSTVNENNQKKHAWFQPESQLIDFAKAFQVSDPVLDADRKDMLATIWYIEPRQPSKVGKDYYSQHPNRIKKCWKISFCGVGLYYVFIVLWTKRFPDRKIVEDVVRMLGTYLKIFCAHMLPFFAKHPTQIPHLLRSFLVRNTMQHGRW